MEAEVREVTEALDPGSDVGTELELVADGGVGEGGGKRRGPADEVERPGADRDQGRRRQVLDRRHVVREADAGILQRLQQYFPRIFHCRLMELKRFSASFGFSV